MNHEWVRAKKTAESLKTAGFCSSYVALTSFFVVTIISHKGGVAVHAEHAHKCVRALLL